MTLLLLYGEWWCEACWLLLLMAFRISKERTNENKVIYMDRQFNAVDHLVKSFGLCSTTRSRPHCAANDSEELDEEKEREKTTAFSQTVRRYLTHLFNLWVWLIRGWWRVVVAFVHSNVKTSNTHSIEINHQRLNDVNGIMVNLWSVSSDPICFSVAELSVSYPTELNFQHYACVCV